MRIQTGTPAPTFSTQDAFGETISLERFAGKWLLLAFFRNAACAICNLHIHHLIERYPTLQQNGLEIVAVFESPTSSIREYVGKQDAPFAIIPDPDAVLYESYGVEVSVEKVEATLSKPETPQVIQAAAAQGFSLTPEEGSNFYRLPAEFLIDPQGIIRIAHYGEFVYDHLELDALERELV
jgi:thioredoxin-dependent peroxiredoxin